ncbi:MAG: hypothetical protein WBX25_04855 [Rhodomicrobium sp.]
MTKEEAQQAIALIKDVQQQVARGHQMARDDLRALSTQIHAIGAEWECHHQANIDRLKRIETLLDKAT